MSRSAKTTESKKKKNFPKRVKKVFESHQNTWVGRKRQTNYFLFLAWLGNFLFKLGKKWIITHVPLGQGPYYGLWDILRKSLVGQGHEVIVSRTITMQGFILPAFTAVEKCTLFLDLTQRYDKIGRACNVGQGHQVMVCGCKVYHGWLLCKVSYSQISLLQINVIYF